LGIDLIIAQRTEAGDHNLGTLPILVLVATILEAAAPTPVLAAGGIVTGRQLAAALALALMVSGWEGQREAFWSQRVTVLWARQARKFVSPPSKHSAL
jgi:Nitronate monooxygenase